MLKSRNILIFVGILLMNALVIGCDSCKKGGKEKGLGEEAEKLVEKFSQEHSLTPKQTETLKKNLQHDQNNTSESEIDKTIKTCNDLKIGLDNPINLMTTKSIFSKITAGFQPKDKATAEKALTQLVEMLESIKQNKGKK